MSQEQNISGVEPAHLPLFGQKISQSTALDNSQKWSQKI